MTHESHPNSVKIHDIEDGAVFLRTQSQLPRSKWSPEFTAFIDGQIAKKIKQPLEQTDESPEVLREQTFTRYMNGLQLNIDNLQNKKVLDMGCGDGEFVQVLTEKDITPYAQGIDVHMSDDRVGEIFHKIDFHELLPFKDLDIIVSVGAVSNEVWHAEESSEAKLNIEQIIKHSLDALSREGEIRIYPIQEAFAETPLEGLQQSKQRWDDVIKDLQQKFNVECIIKPSNVRVSGDNNDLILESVLIIRKNL